MNRHSQNINKREGFTLIEAMLSLVITTFAILIIGATMSDVRKSNYHNDITKFYLYMNIIEKQGYKVTKWNPQQLTLKKNGKIYYVIQKDSRLVMTSKKGGYMPLLYKVKDVKWYRTKDGLLDHYVVMLNNQQFNGKSRLNE